MKVSADSTFSSTVVHSPGVSIPPALNPGLSWFPVTQGFTFAGAGNDLSIQFEIKNTWGNSVILDPSGTLVNDTIAPGSSLWGVQWNGSLKSMQHGGPIPTPLTFNFALAFRNQRLPSLAVSVQYAVSFPTNPAPPTEFSLISLNGVYDKASGYTYVGRLSYTGKFIADGSGSGWGSVVFSRMQTPEFETSDSLMGGMIAMLSTLR